MLNGWSQTINTPVSNGRNQNGTWVYKYAPVIFRKKTCVPMYKSHIQQYVQKKISRNLSGVVILVEYVHPQLRYMFAGVHMFLFRMCCSYTLNTIRIPHLSMHVQCRHELLMIVVYSTHAIGIQPTKPGVDTTLDVYSYKDNECEDNIVLCHKSSMTFSD